MAVGRLIEVEVKASVGGRRTVERALRRIGASKLGEFAQEDTYYSHPFRDFGLTDEAVRIRVSDEEASLTYKGPKLDKRSKSREEIEIPLEHPTEARELLHRLGFRPIGAVIKKRRVYSKSGFKICLDEVAGLGTFMEIEKKVEGRSYSTTLRAALRLLRELGGEREERRSYLELLLLKKKAKLRGS